MSACRYVIMANGRGRRWGNYGGKPKHLIEIGNETLLTRTIRLLRSYDCDAEVIISSSDPRCEVSGVRRYEPLRNDCEIDRFVCELICDDVCFLYGDTFYTEGAMQIIVSSYPEDLLFYGNDQTIVAVRAALGARMLDLVNRVRHLYLTGEINQCKGWQLYQLYAGLPFGKPSIGADFIEVRDATTDFNSPGDLKNFFLGRGVGCAQYGKPTMEDNERWSC